jgi:hypothetical protein
MILNGFLFCIGVFLALVVITGVVSWLEDRLG